MPLGPSLWLYDGLYTILKIAKINNKIKIAMIQKLLVLFATEVADSSWQFLYFFQLPQKQGSFLPTFFILSPLLLRQIKQNDLDLGLCSYAL